MLEHGALLTSWDPSHQLPLGKESQLSSTTQAKGTHLHENLPPLMHSQCGSPRTFVKSVLDLVQPHHLQNHWSWRGPHVLEDFNFGLAVASHLELEVIVRHIFRWNPATHNPFLDDMQVLPILADGIRQGPTWIGPVPFQKKILSEESATRTPITTQVSLPDNAPQLQASSQW